MHTRITHPDQLTKLTTDRLLECVRPILRKGDLTTTKERSERVRPNIPSAVWELAAQWKNSPYLDDRKVGFDEYLAARLCSHLHSLDRQEHKELYEGGRFQPLHFSLPLDAAGNVGSTPAYPIFETGGWRERMQETFLHARIEQPSQNELLSRMQRHDAGATITRHGWSRLEGMPPEMARNRPADLIVRLMNDVLNHDRDKKPD